MLFDLPPLEALVSTLKGMEIPQRTLATKARVSQATISKLYGGHDARYSVVRRICQAAEVEVRARESRLRAGDICSHPVRGVPSSATVREAVDLMREKQFDQVVVFDGKEIVGSLAWPQLLKAVNAGMAVDELMRQPVRSFAQPPFPIVNGDESLAVVEMLLAYHPAVLVRTGGRTDGIITWHDVLRPGRRSR